MKSFRRQVGVALSIIILAFYTPAEAQQPAKVPRIGYLSGSSRPAMATRYKAFLEGLRELGYLAGC